MHTLMVVHAHPDDEVFSTGGTIAKYAAAGDRVILVYSTRGDMGEIHHPDLDPDDARPRLADIREAEAREACALLGVSEIYFLGYRDSGMRDTEDNKHPEAFMNAPLEDAAERLYSIMKETRPDVVVTYDEEGGYGHPDHVMTNRVTVEAFEQARRQPWGPKRLYYPARSREAFRGYAEGLAELGLKIPWLQGDFNFDEYGLPNAEISTHIDIAPYVGLKKAALAVHRTQIPADFFYLSIPDEAMARFAGVEFFVRVYPPPVPGEGEDDLLAGLREPEAATPGV